MNATFESHLRARMKHLGLSQSALCDKAGISRQTLHSLLHGAQNLPNLQTVLQLAGALQSHPMRLLQLLCDEHASLWAQPATQRRLRGDRSAFVRDVTYPDGELVLPGQRFVKTWELQNLGQVPWEGRLLQCMDEAVVVQTLSGEVLRVGDGLKPLQGLVPIPFTPPQAHVQVSVEFVAPNSPGTVLSYWKAVHADGRLCYPKSRGVWVKVLVSLLDASMAEES